MPKSTTSCDILSDFAFNSTIGKINVVACKEGIHKIKLISRKVDGDNVPNLYGKVQDTFGVVKWFEDYCNAVETNIEPRLCWNNISEFDKTVYIALAKVPRGEIISYSDLSERAFGTSTKARSVGTAMARNPFMILVPCHRVVKSSGEIGAYSGAGGSATKEWLIDFEKEPTQKGTF